VVAVAVKLGVVGLSRGRAVTSISNLRSRSGEGGKPAVDVGVVWWGGEARCRLGCRWPMRLEGWLTSERG
jgi:hypothetical protein